MLLIIAFAGFLLLLARSCGGDEPPPAMIHSRLLARDVAAISLRPYAVVLLVE